MKISIVIPAYNEEKYINKCLQSLEKQMVGNLFEIIVCLNACTDRTPEIVDQFTKTSKLNVKLVWERKKGVVFARQTGFKNAKGDIIASADADTEYPLDWTKKINDDFRKYPDMAVVYGPVYLKDGTIFQRFLSKYGYTLFLIASRLFGYDNVTGMNFAVRKEAFEKVLGYDLSAKSAEEIILVKKIKKAGGKVFFDKDLVVYSSARRFKLGFLNFLKHHIRNYIRVFIFKKPPLDFKDIR